MSSFSKAGPAPKTQHPIPPLRWKPTDPEGRRWELWDDSQKSPEYLGRVLVLHRERVSFGCFTAYTPRRRGGGNSLEPCRWRERETNGMARAARKLIRLAQKKTPAAKRR
jgi:hypothetical protein